VNRAREATVGRHCNADGLADIRRRVNGEGHAKPGVGPLVLCYVPRLDVVRGDSPSDGILAHLDHLVMVRGRITRVDRACEGALKVPDLIVIFIDLSCDLLVDPECLPRVRILPISGVSN
jgi:hypothetical protein